jgi:tetratricopeptide (TPR) repeat protein
MTRSRTLWVTAALLAFAWWGARGVAVAQQPAEAAESPGQPFYDQGRQAYADRQYAQALELLVQAVQADPTDPRYWVGAARAANFAEQFDVAVRLYDVYIAHHAAHAEAARRQSDRLAAIRRERDQANGRRANSATPPGPTADQLAARAMFVERLETGPVVAADGSGALTLYRTLLRTGYVDHDLIELRQRLSEGILTQLQTLFEPTDTSPVPVLDTRTWEQVPVWYEAAAALGQPVLQQPGVRARLATAEGQRQLLNANHSVALEQFRQAVALDPRMVAPRIGILMAQHRIVQREGCCLDPSGVQDHLDVIAAGLPSSAPYREGLLQVLRAMVASDSGDQRLAADYLLMLFTDRAAPRPSTR